MYREVYKKQEAATIEHENEIVAELHYCDSLPYMRLIGSKSDIKLNRQKKASEVHIYEI